MTRTDDDKTIIPTDVQRRDGGTINQSAQQIDPAGRHRQDVNANVQGEHNTKQPGNLGEDDKKVRDAGPKEMRNPPGKWDKTDEEGDESFPASDPPANY
ncbi:hypothetical protein [Pseudooceanicola spongiae]|uniref:Uncharacterized protein n=1 Tax=Pseudooceanicola spongiae TaxID=2613965 RepID=A0A7L9WPB8_9RHOB|nr:hypothetical protein [Pseudooceanicola spongiae]QOL80950.1 hypothetical protein F3W81_09060 [Pseudooceanicola spongiae]